MPIIEPYKMGHIEGPRNCQHDLSEKHHTAEMILHSADGRSEHYLCKRHAAMALSHDLDQMAMAVVETALAFGEHRH